MLTKYYVESGSKFQFIVLAMDEMDALLKALTLTQAGLDDEEPLCLANLMIVNQRGFVWERPNQELYGDEFVLPTHLVLGMPEEEAK